MAGRSRSSSQGDRSQHQADDDAQRDRRQDVLAGVQREDEGHEADQDQRSLRAVRHQQLEVRFRREAGQSALFSACGWTSGFSGWTRLRKRPFMPLGSAARNRGAYRTFGTSKRKEFSHGHDVNKIRQRKRRGAHARGSRSRHRAVEGRHRQADRAVAGDRPAFLWRGAPCGSRRRRPVEGAGRGGDGEFAGARQRSRRPDHRFRSREAADVIGDRGRRRLSCSLCCRDARPGAAACSPR